MKYRGGRRAGNGIFIVVQHKPFLCEHHATGTGCYKAISHVMSTICEVCVLRMVCALCLLRSERRAHAGIASYLHFVRTKETFRRDPVSGRLPIRDLLHIKLRC